VNADSNLQFKVTIASGENGQLVGKLHSHTTCFTRHRSQPTTGIRNTDTHDRHTQLTSCCCCFTIDNTADEPLKQNGSTTKRDTAQNKLKMEEARVCGQTEKNKSVSKLKLLHSGSHTFDSFTHATLFWQIPWHNRTIMFFLSSKSSSRLE
jgi:hypothetical protein